MGDNSASGPRQQKMVISRRGGPEVLTLADEPIPQPGLDQLRLRVVSTGVAFDDVLMREGLYPGTPSYPFAPGYDVVGEIDAFGPGAGAEMIPGQRVAALTVTGGYARYIVLPEIDCVRVPDGVDSADAVSIILNYLTAFQMLHRVAAAVPGSRILVHGAAGGVGSALVELGAASGCAIFGTASKSKHALLRRLGAVPIDYRSEDFVTRIRELTVAGVDAVFDPVGGHHWRQSFKTLRPGGVLVCYGASAATRNGRRSLWNILRVFASSPRFSPLSLLRMSRGVHGFNVTLWKQTHPDLYRADLATLLGMLAEGRIAPVIAARMPLERAAEAHRMLQSASVTGKIVLEPQF
ncbi:MAG: medium chain dehydrogenase/reductase family protein [Beijerinckiaceae bacterium]|nr:medium chain dehydrogenase/reductase family protein [Beijerinckiaceae bacterium]